MDGERGESHAVDQPVTDRFSREQRLYLQAAEQCGGRVAPLLEVLETLTGALAPAPGRGRTLERWRFLAAAASADVTAARVVEPHLDAVAILDEAGGSGAGDLQSGRTWGVFAAEGPGAPLVAAERDGGWYLDGVKPWCSLGGRLTDALITARTGDAGTGAGAGADERRMFRVRLRQPGVRAEGVEWVARGLADVESGPLTFAGAPAEPVGGPGWYLSRPGFRWGAIGVAACWWGGCLPLFDALRVKAARAGAGPLAASRVGRLARVLQSARLVLEHSADVIDRSGTEGRPSDDDAAVLAHAVRGEVADAVAETLSAVRDVLGPMALAFDEPVARRCADLELYVAQYHRGPDDVSLFAHLSDGFVSGGASW